MIRGDMTPLAIGSGLLLLLSSSAPKPAPVCSVWWPQLLRRVCGGDWRTGDAYALSLSSASQRLGLDATAASVVPGRCAVRTANGGGEPGEWRPATPNSSEVSSELSFGDVSGVEKPLNDGRRGEPMSLSSSLQLRPENGTDWTSSGVDAFGASLWLCTMSIVTGAATRCRRSAYVSKHLLSRAN